MSWNNLPQELIDQIMGYLKDTVHPYDMLQLRGVSKRFQRDILQSTFYEPNELVFLKQTQPTLPQPWQLRELSLRRRYCHMPYDLKLEYLMVNVRNRADQKSLIFRHIHDLTREMSRLENHPNPTKDRFETIAHHICCAYLDHYRQSAMPMLGEVRKLEKPQLDASATYRTPWPPGEYGLLDQGDLDQKYTHIAALAASMGNLNIVQHQVKFYGLPYDAESELFGSILTNAARGGHTEIVRWHLDNGANINAKPFLATSLPTRILATPSECTQSFRYDADTSWHGTALEAAAQAGHMAVVDLMLYAIYNLDTSTTMHSLDHASAYASAIYRAAAHNHSAVATRLLRYARWDYDQDKVQDWILRQGCRDGRAPAVSLMLRMGVDPFRADPLEGKLPLHWAACNGDLATFRLLESRHRSARVPLTAEDDSHAHVLALACMHGHIPLVDHLLDGTHYPFRAEYVGKKRFSPYKHKRTPVVWAAKGARLAVLQHLVSRHNADILGAAAENGARALCYAAGVYSWPVMEWLLRQGVNVEGSVELRGFPHTFCDQAGAPPEVMRRLGSVWGAAPPMALHYLRQHAACVRWWKMTVKVRYGGERTGVRLSWDDVVRGEEGKYDL